MVRRTEEMALSVAATCGDTMSSPSASPAHTRAFRFQHPLFLLYTLVAPPAKPKGIMHTSGGYFTSAAKHDAPFSMPPDSDVFSCTADRLGHRVTPTGASTVRCAILSHRRYFYEGTPDNPTDTGISDH